MLVPGAGHAILGQRRAMLVFVVPVLLLAVGLLGYYAGGGVTAILAFVVTPGVLPALAILNIALGHLENRRQRRCRPADGEAPRLHRPSRSGPPDPGDRRRTCGSAPRSRQRTTSSNSMFASAPEPEETEEPWITPPPDWTPPPLEYETPEPLASPDPSATPGPTPTKKPPREPMTAGIGNLPPLNVAVPWDRPGAVPWGDDGRFDLLLLGSDAGPDRWSRRMDTMLLVEIDVSNGKVAMIGIPRNMQNAPFPPGPARNAVKCGCFTPLLNGLYVEATVSHPGRWPGSGSVKGIGAVRAVVSELTGRPIDAVLVADLWGVIKVIDAMGGIDINVPDSVYDERYPDPVMGRIELFIPAGKQHLNGRMALAYARSRHQDSDYSRMARQQTLLLAIRDDIGGDTIVNAPSLFKAAKGFAWTDLPRSSLPNLVTLFSNASNASVKNLRLVPPKYPAWLTPSIVAKIHRNIASMLGLPPPTPPPTPPPRPPLRRPPRRRLRSARLRPRRSGPPHSQRSVIQIVFFSVYCSRASRPLSRPPKPDCL